MQKLILGKGVHGKKDRIMFHWLGEIPNWLIGSASAALFCAVMLWGAKDQVRRGGTRTLLGGVVVELVQVLFVGALVLFIFTTAYPSGETLPNRLVLQYVSSGVLCTIIGLFCLRWRGPPARPFNRAVWAAVVIFIVASYLFYRGWTHAL